MDKPVGLQCVWMRSTVCRLISGVWVLSSVGFSHTHMSYKLRSSLDDRGVFVLVCGGDMC